MAVDFRGHPMFPRGFNGPTRFGADVYYACPPPHNDWMTGFNGDGHALFYG
ncbi:MAG: hypothetical protein LOD94_15500 [Gammaproteobacteria bacterium]